MATMSLQENEDQIILEDTATSKVVSQCIKKVDAVISSVDSTMEQAEISIVSVRDTIAAIDGMQAKWKDIQKKFGEALTLSLSSIYGVEAPNMLTDEEKEAVFGGNPTLEELCTRLRGNQYKNIIVMAGAGISVSAGIPDFRTPGSGLYHTLNLKDLNVPSPEAVFDLNFFHTNPEPFFKIVKELFYSRTVEPTVTHHFIKLLADKKLLLRCYTQNIDGLERKAGIFQDLLVEAHGSYEDATCTNSACRKKYSSASTDLVKSAVLDGRIPECDSCNKVVKPDIVFFGEELPERFKCLLEADFTTCDLLIVMGTSLQVAPFSRLIHKVKQATPRVLINKNKVGSFSFQHEGGYRDIGILEDCDHAVQELCSMCGWTEDLDKLLQTRQNSRKEKAPPTDISNGSSANQHTSSTASYKKSSNTTVASALHSSPRVSPRNSSTSPRIFDKKVSGSGTHRSSSPKIAFSKHHHAARGYTSKATSTPKSTNKRL